VSVTQKLRITGQETKMDWITSRPYLKRFRASPPWMFEELPRSAFFDDLFLIL
jgi:hypothetical protein